MNPLVRGVRLLSLSLTGGGREKSPGHAGNKGVTGPRGTAEAKVAFSHPVTSLGWTWQLGGHREGSATLEEGQGCDRLSRGH